MLVVIDTVISRRERLQRIDESGARPEEERKMGAPGEPVEESDLHGWVDGRLTPEREEAIEAYFAVHPDARERWRQYAEQRAALRAAFAAEVTGPLPARFRIPRLLQERRHRRQRWFIQIAAAVCLVVLGCLGGWVARDVVPQMTSSTSAHLGRAIIADAIAAHRTFAVEVRHPVEVNAAQKADLVEWLSKRLGRPLVVPDLAAMGFRLMGGRLLPAESGPAAQLMYENDGGIRLTVYLQAGVAGEVKLFRNDKDVGALYWSDEGLGCVIVGDATRAILRTVAATVYEQTFPDAPKGEFSSDPERTG